MAKPTKKKVSRTKKERSDAEDKGIASLKLAEENMFTSIEDHRRYREFLARFDGDMFGERLKISRLARGLSQDVLAKMFEPKLSQSAIVEWEKERSAPKKERMGDLAKFLGAPEVWLVLGQLSHTSIRLYLGLQKTQQAITETANTSMILETPYEVEPKEISEEEIAEYFHNAQSQLLTIFRYASKDEEKQSYQRTISTLEDAREEILEELDNQKRRTQDVEHERRHLVKQRDSFEYREKKAEQEARRLDLPLMGTAAASDGEGAFQFETSGTAIDFFKRPQGLVNENDAYMIYVIGHSMSPRFNQGEFAVVNPKRPPALNDYVVVQMKYEDDDPAIVAYLKILVRQNDDELVLRQHNPEKEIILDASRVDKIHRVLPWSEVLGW